MNNLDRMLEHNKDFAARQSATGTRMPSLPRALPNVKSIIIGCADMRVDPAEILGIKLGEAVVMRNIGGRITPGLLEELGLLGRIGEVAAAIPGGGGEFHIIVLHHTDCGITRLAGDPARAQNPGERRRPGPNLDARLRTDDRFGRGREEACGQLYQSSADEAAGNSGRDRQGGPLPRLRRRLLHHWRRTQR